MLILTQKGASLHQALHFSNGDVGNHHSHKWETIFLFFLSIIILNNIYMMKPNWLLLFSIFLAAQAIDICTQMVTYQQCISNSEEQCMWNHMIEQCKKSNNYLLGCQNTLSVKLCVKQFGTIVGEIGTCIFRDFCQKIRNFDEIRCTDRVSRAGCLAITNPAELCKWENLKCQSLNTQEMQLLSGIFMNLELSASVCPLIDGYLILHHTVLWPLIGYEPDLIAEAEAFVDIENGRATASPKAYSEGLLQNSYVNQNGYFIWYSLKQPKSSQESNLKLNDKTRYGCIAQEILSETNFLLLFSLTGEIRSVNHVYCKYLNLHPTNPQMTIFANRKCIPVTANQLQDQSFISQNNLTCRSMGPTVCQRLKSETLHCSVSPTDANGEKEFQCVTKTTQKQNLVCASDKSDTYDICVTGEICYLDMTSSQATCSRTCYDQKSKEACIQYKSCKWNGDKVGVAATITDIIIYCVPLGGCTQFGLSKKYCLSMADTCYWNQAKNQCEYASNLDRLKCTEANTVYTCGSITLTDQYCIWQNECINVLDSSLLSHFYGLGGAQLMNRNQCMQQTLENHYFDNQQFYCPYNIYLGISCQNRDAVQTESQCNTEFGKQLSKYYCLNLYMSYTRWDQYKQICINLLESKVMATPCEQNKLVNALVCRKALNPDSTKLCLHDPETNSCFIRNKSDLQLTCNDGGIDESTCLSISKEGQYCQFYYGRCRPMTFRIIQQFKCMQLSRINGNVCSSLHINESCMYVANEQACMLSFAPQPNCEYTMNPSACQQSAASCYYDQARYGCFSTNATLLGQLQCEGSFVSKSACSKISTPDQACYWDVTTKKCKNYSSFYATTCDLFPDINQLACTKLATLYTNNFVAGTYCEFSNNVCAASSTVIDDADCGQTKAINVHRCNAYTNSGNKLCYFQLNKCILLSGPTEYQATLLSQMTCNQVNLNLCNQVTTTSQVCKKITVGTDIKCTKLPKSVSETCSNLGNFYDMLIHNNQICSIASDACVYNPLTFICGVLAANTVYDCQTIGLSSIACTQNTVGPCVFVDRGCQLISDYSVPCDVRNQMACSLGTTNCVWNNTNKKCEITTDFCPTTYGQTSTWSVCRLSSSSCFASKDGCSTSAEKDLPCWASLSVSLCSTQNHICTWIDDRCMDFNDDLCENAKTQKQCVLNRNFAQKCVYHNSKCFHASSSYRCNQFDYTSFQFCRQFPDCIHTLDFQCQNYRSAIANKQKDLENLYQFSCAGFTNSYDCIFQRTVNCQFQSSTASCTTSSITSCNQDLTVQQSILACESVSNCNFAATNQGEGFCYLNSLTCESLNPSLCVKDVPNLSCFFDESDNKCKVSTFSTCASIAGKKANYSACLVASNGTNNCIYEHSSNLCKPSARIVQANCAAATTLSACTFAQNLDCLVNSSPGITCTNGSGTLVTSENQWTNFYGCIKLASGMAVFNFNSYKCETIAEDTNFNILTSLLRINTCRQVNQNACIKLTSEVGLRCIWKNNICRDLQKGDESEPCEARNKLSCLSANQELCVWHEKKCKTTPAFDVTTCGGNCLFSLAYCTSKSQLASLTNQCYTNTATTFFAACTGLGLSKSQCMLNTPSLLCYWTGAFCAEANPFVNTCSQDLNEFTCKSIKTPGQHCKWDGAKCIQVSGSTCADYNYIEHGCLSLMIPCFYDSSTNLCRETTRVYDWCSSRLSRHNCINVLNEICMISNGQCSTWNQRFFNCQSIVNRYGCYYAVMNCIWNEQTGCQPYTDVTPKPCKDLPVGLNQFGCKTLNSDSICTFDKVKLACSYKLTSREAQGVNLNLVTGYTQPLLIENCNSFTQRKDCIRSRKPGQACEWSNSAKCVESTKQQCLNQNIYACVNSSSQCAWRDYECVAWIYGPSTPDLTYAEVALVSRSVCATLAPSLFAKYDAASYSCVATDLDKESCNVEGISYQTCVSLNSHACVFSQNQCSDFKVFDKPVCAGYQHVSYQVCQRIPNLACKYDMGLRQCTSTTAADGCLTQGLSRYGCLTITSQACEWNGTSCQIFTPKYLIDQCDKSTPRNAKACSQISYLKRPCSFDSVLSVCSPKFNPFSLCNTPGLNLHACVQIEREACIFTTQCQQFLSFEYKCFQASNVNAYACRTITADNCKYETHNYKCQSAYSYSPCNTLGLNHGACMTSKNCLWNLEQLQCYCNTQKLINSCQISESACLLNPSCRFVSGQCQIKECDHLSICKGTMNGKQCYTNQDNQCLGASRCEDIVFLNAEFRCDQFIFNGRACMQIDRYCISPTNFAEYCPVSECKLDKCIFESGFCREVACRDLSQSNCFQMQGCAFIDGKCVALNSCSDITDQIICNQASFNNLKCSWQEYGLLDQTQWCTNSYCNQFGASSTLCTGNEINGRTCALTFNLQCRMCEQITDVCECQNTNNACYYSNGQCNSQLCENYLNKDNCEVSKRCYWSEKDTTCRKMCVQNIRQDACELLSYECHWDKYKRICVQGQRQVPDLSVKIKVQDIFSYLLVWSLALLTIL